MSADLDRAAIRESVLERFSAERMTDGYEAIYRPMLEANRRRSAGKTRSPSDRHATVPPERLATRRAERIAGPRSSVASGARTPPELAARPAVGLAPPVSCRPRLLPAGG